MEEHEPFPCLVVRRDAAGEVVCGVEQITVNQLPPGEVLIQVGCSSLNYKDALACQAQSGIVKRLPHVPGIDCAGRVAESSEPDYCPSDPVLVTGYGLGADQWGGFSRYVRVPSEWVVRRPPGWNSADTMIFGTAGFTAAQSVLALERHGIKPESGEVVVTGASGAVGSLAVAILGHLGYQVAAVTGKPQYADILKELGAQRILAREELDDSSGRPLQSATWAGAVDTVGGNMLASLLASTRYRGCVATCGMVGGTELNTSVYPFILRGVTLHGVDSAKCPREPRLEIWNLLAHQWRPPKLDLLRREITLSQVPAVVDEMLAGKSFGRVLVRPTA